MNIEVERSDINGNNWTVLLKDKKWTMVVVRRRGYIFLAVTFFVIATNCNVSSSSSSSTPSTSHGQGRAPPPPPTASPTQLPSILSHNLSDNPSESDSVGKSLIVNENATTSSSSSSPPSELLKQEEFMKNNNIGIGPDINHHPPQQQQHSHSTSSSSSSSSLAFLYELYEHEIFNPKSNTWASRRFTQSPTTGGGGRDSTSLDPQSCTPPRNYVFADEWKIDMTDRDSGTRDGFGWEYYVGKYDGLGRRRRRWIRSLVRIRSSTSSSISGSSLENGRPVSARKKSSMKRSSSSDAKKTKTKTSRSSMQQPPQQSKTNALLHILQDQTNFKGFGWSINKSLVHARAFGTTFRLPISANIDSYDRIFAAPYISASTYFGYPWVAAALLNASLPVEAIRWIIGGVIWKLQWGVAVISALIRGVAELVIWIVLWPWRLWMATFRLMGIFTGSRSVPTVKQNEEDATTKLLSNDITKDRAATTRTKSVIKADDELNVSIETHIEIQDSGEMSATTATAAAAAAVVDSPRGGATNVIPPSFFARKHLTMLGHEIPTFHRTTSLAYSSTIQERIGVAVSWRVSRMRGYEYRCNLFFTCMPTRLFWEQVDEELKKHVPSVRRVVSAWKGVSDQSSKTRVGDNEIDNIPDKDASRLEAKPSLSSNRPKSHSITSALTSFLNDHSSTVGISGGWPMPAPPHFAFNLVLSMSGFYIGWLFAYIRSIFVLPLPKSLHHQSDDEEFRPNSDLSPISEKLVSSALKNKLPLEEVDVDDDMEDTDEEESIAASS